MSVQLGAFGYVSLIDFYLGKKWSTENVAYIAFFVDLHQNISKKPHQSRMVDIKGKFTEKNSKKRGVNKKIFQTE